MAPKKKGEKAAAAAPAPKKAEEPKKDEAKRRSRSRSKTKPAAEAKRRSRSRSKTKPAAGSSKPVPAAPQTSKVLEKEPPEDPKKRKAEATDGGPPKKEVKFEEEKKSVAEEPGEAENDGGEKETDAPADKRPPLKETIGFNSSDMSLNVVPTVGGTMLMALSDGGLQYFVGGARANVGVTGGRYMFEVKVVEALTLSEHYTGKARPPLPKQLLRVGFSTASSPVVLGDNDESVFFDAEGAFHASKKRSQVSKRFGRGQVVAVLLNLDGQSPNANTVSLFVDGVRAGDPQALPASLTESPTLFPHVAFRNVSVHVNFGPEPLKALPFKCRMLQGAAQADVKSARSAESKDGKYEVLLPVAFPDQGTFDWVDDFLEKNPKYVELSDRKILEWAQESGVVKPWSQPSSRGSNDRPEFNFGLPGMDDLSVRKVIESVAPLVPRNYVVMEVKENLLEASRKEVLQRFSAPCYKKVAQVFMGEPSNEWKERTREALLKVKQNKANAEFEVKKKEKERKKQMMQRQKQREKEVKQRAKERQKMIAAAKKLKEQKLKEAKEAAKKAAEVRKASRKEDDEDGESKQKTEDGDAMDDGKDEDKKAEKEEAKEEEEDEKEEEEQDEEEKDEEEEAEEEEEEEEPPKVELTEEEEKDWFPSKPVKDLTDLDLNQSFGKFTIPEKSEGFDDICFLWQTGPKSKEYLKKWVLEKKLSSRIEDLEPSQWFHDQFGKWQKLVKEWQQKQTDFKILQKKKDQKKDGGEEDDRDVEMEELDIFSVEDVCNIGNDIPLFEKFGFEDWALMQLRYELHLLVTAFKKDVDDMDRPGIHEDHLDFYYNRYFHKQLNPRAYGLNTLLEVVDLVKDTVAINAKDKVLTANLTGDPEEVGIYVKLTEESRRERQRRIDAGDETARMKFNTVLIQQQRVEVLQKPQQQVQQQRGAASLPHTVPARIPQHQQWGKGASNPAKQQWPAPRGAAQPGWRPGGQMTYAQKQQKWGR